MLMQTILSFLQYVHSSCITYDANSQSVFYVHTSSRSYIFSLHVGQLLNFEVQVSVLLVQIQSECQNDGA